MYYVLLLNNNKKMTVSELSVECSVYLNVLNSQTIKQYITDASKLYPQIFERDHMTIPMKILLNQ